MTLRDPSTGEPATLAVADLAAYLHARGWKGAPTRDGRLVKFAAPPDAQGRSMSIVLPTSDDFVDTPQRIAEALAVLADLASEPVPELGQRIRTLRRDVLRVRIGTAGLDAGLPLHRVPELVDELGNVLAFSACAEEEPLPAFTKQRKIGRTFLESCTFGQTFHGSFGLSIEAPVMAPPSLFPGPTPFERRVTTRLFRGLGTLRTALELGNPELLEADFKDGLNANMCDALVRVAELTDEQVVYDPVWSPLVTPPPGLLQMKPVAVGGRAVDLLEATSRRLRTTAQGREITLSGHVVRLQARRATGATDVEPDAEREVVIESDDRLRVHVRLDLASYREACDAHRDGRRVRVKGTLEKPGKSWTLMKPEGFTMLFGADDLAT